LGFAELQQSLHRHQSLQFGFACLQSHFTALRDQIALQFGESELQHIHASSCCRNTANPNCSDSAPHQHAAIAESHPDGHTARSRLSTSRTFSFSGWAVNMIKDTSNLPSLSAARANLRSTRPGGQK